MGIRLVVFVLLLFGFNSTKCQIAFNNQTIFKKGIYKNIEELKSNNPTLELKYLVKEKSRPIGNYFLMKHTHRIFWI